MANNKLLILPFIALALMLPFANATGQTPSIKISNNPTIYGIPDFITANQSVPSLGSFLVTVTVIGGGGNGGGHGGQRSGGGGGGASATNTFLVTPGNVINYNIGSSGGGTTWFGGSLSSPMVSADGGVNAIDGEGGTTPGGLGGSTGVGSTIYMGGNGGNATTFAGAGGGGAGATSNGGNGGQLGTIGHGGTGTPSGGDGGKSSAAGNGFTGNVPGGGGGGGSTGFTGGAGAAGEIYITYGATNVLLTSGSTWTVPGVDNITIGYCVGSGTCSTPTVLTSGSGNQIYTVCDTIPTLGNCLGVGTYNVVANDMTAASSYNSTILTVTQSAPPLTWTAQCSSGSYIGTPCTTTANIMTIGDQLSASLYLNNALVSSTNTAISNSVNAIGSYTYTFNTLGNGNYISNSISYSFIIIPSISQPTISNSIIDVGQYETFNTMFTGGTTPYTYNWIISNAVTGAVVNTITFSNALQTNTIAFQIPQYFTTNSPLRANVVVTDANPITANSIYSSNFIVNPQLVSTAISSPTATNTLDNGQTLTISITAPTTGSPPYSYSWSAGSTTCPTFTSATTSSFTYNPTSGTSSNCQFTATVTDSATTNEVYTATTPIVYVNTAMSPTISASLTPSVIIGQTEVFTAMAGGGSQSYTYNYIVTNSVTGTILATALHTGVSSSTDTFNWVVPSADIYNTIQANVIITDSATTHVTANSIKIGTISIIGDSLAADSATVTNSIIDNGQSTTLTSNPIGGLPPYSINWFSGAGCTGGVLGTSASLSVSPSTNAVYSYNAIDSVPTAVCSPSSSITVYATPSSKLTFLTGNALLFGFNAIANDIVTGGSGSFTWQWTINNAGVANSMVSPTQTSSSYVYPPQGSYTYNVIFTDTGTTTPYVGSQVSNVLVISQNNQPNNALSFTLIPSYSYNSPQNGYTANTAGQLYNLLNYLYTLNAISYYGINSVSINFGANSVSSGNSIAFTGSPSIASNSMWNIYQNNAITSYNAVVTINDIYGDVLSNTVVFTTNTYVYPRSSAPQLYLSPPSYSASTYTKINTPITFNAVQNSFPLSNATLYPFYSNSVIIPISSFNTIIANSLYQSTAYYNYQSNTPAGGLTLNSIATDINGFSSSINTTTGDTVLTYNPGSTTLLTASGLMGVNLTYSFSLTSGNYGMKSINVYWGDGTNSIYSYNTPQTSNTFALSHEYLIPQIYTLVAYSTDNSPNGGAISSTLSNPTLTISAYIPPQVISVTPSTRFNGANDNTENFTFYMQEGSFSLKNMTINWNDGVSSIGHNKTTSMVALSASQMPYTISHTFPLPTAYYTNVTICDIQGICATYPTPITIGQAPLSQNSIGSIYNDTARRNNQTALNNSATIQENINPTETYAIGAIIFSIGVISVIYYFRVRKRGRK